MNQERLEQIKAELEEQITRVNAILAENKEGTFTFTKKQLIDFTRNLVDSVVDNIKEQIDDMDVDEGVVELDFDSYDNRINISIDENAVRDAAKDSIEVHTEDDSYVEDMINITLGNIGVIVKFPVKED